jgi:hypothetical protein
MRFRTFYLEEKERTKIRNISDLKNQIAGAAGKQIESEEDRENGKFFQITSVGAWSVLKTKLQDAMVGFDLKATDFTNITFVDGKVSLYVRYQQNTVKFYLTNDPKQKPVWDSPKEPGTEISTDKNSSTEQTSSPDKSKSETPKEEESSDKGATSK